MAFRETIEAILKVKDGNRFKASMEGAARSVRKFGRDEEEAAAQAEILKEMEKKLERQSLELTAALELVAHSVNNLGDQMVETAAKSELLNRGMKKSGTNAVFLGKSWAFWKDRLSLTRSEIMTTALTIGTYFLPAIIGLGSSFAYAAVGGGGVALGGLSTLLFGFGTFMAILKPVTDGIKKVMKAQDEYNVTVQQYGAASIQASRASAHLYGVINANGGKPVLNLVTNLRKLSDAWKQATAPARKTLIETILQGLGTAKSIMPVFSIGANQMGYAFQKAIQNVFKDLKGPDIKMLFSDLTDTFNQAIGPALKGTSNFMVVMARVIRATLPYVVELAKWWENITAGWRRSTKDQSKLDKFFKTAVYNFKLWVKFGSALWRVLRIIFSVSHGEGEKTLTVLTKLVNKFGDWLEKMRDTGQITRFWQLWNNSVRIAFWAIQHPADAFNRFFPQVLALVDKWLPVVMDHVANAFVNNAGSIAETFIMAWINAGAWAKLLTAAVILRKFGFFGYIGKKVGTMFVEPFIAKFATAFLASIGIEFAEGSTIATAMGGAGGRLGKAFGIGFRVAALASVVFFSAQINQWLTKQDWYKKLTGTGKSSVDKKVGGGGKVSTFLKGITPGNPFQTAKSIVSSFSDFGSMLLGSLPNPFKPHLPSLGGQLGGIIPPGGSSLVGEAGPELAIAGPRGTQIRPLSGNSRHTLPSMGVPALPNLSDMMNITVHSYVMVDKREVGRAVNNQNNYDKARRGGRASPSVGFDIGQGR